MKQRPTGKALSDSRRFALRRADHTLRVRSA